MASKKELERRIELLERRIELLEGRIEPLGREINKTKTSEYFYFTETVEPTLKGKVDAIINHLGIEVVVKLSEEKVVARKVKK